MMNVIGINKSFPLGISTFWELLSQEKKKLEKLTAYFFENK